MLAHGSNDLPASIKEFLSQVVPDAACSKAQKMYGA